MKRRARIGVGVLFAAAVTLVPLTSAAAAWGTGVVTGTGTNTTTSVSPPTSVTDSVVFWPEGQVTVTMAAPNEPVDANGHPIQVELEVGQQVLAASANSCPTTGYTYTDYPASDTSWSSPWYPWGEYVCVALGYTNSYAWSSTLVVLGPIQV